MNLVRIFIIFFFNLFLIYFFCVFFSLPLIQLMIEDVFFFLYEFLVLFYYKIFKFVFFFVTFFNFLVTFYKNLSVNDFELFFYQFFFILYFLKNNLFSIYYFLLVFLGFVFNTNFINLTNLMSYSIYLFIFVFFRYFRYFDSYILEEILEDEDYTQSVLEESNKVNNLHFLVDSFLTTYNKSDFYYLRKPEEDLFLFDIFVPDLDYISFFEETDLIEEKEFDTIFSRVQLFFSRYFWNCLEFIDNFILKFFLSFFQKYDNPLSFFSKLFLRFLFIPSIIILLIKKLFNFLYNKFKRK